MSRGWWYLFVVLTLWAAVAIVWVATDPFSGSEIDGPTILNTTPEGYSHLAAYLDGAAEVTLLDRPLSRIEPAATTIFRLTSPVEVPDAEDETWLRRGGRLVLGCGSCPSSDTSPIEKVLPELDGVRDIALPGEVPVLENVPPDARSIFSTDSGVVLAAMKVGRGELILLSIPEALSNAHLGSADHLGLAVSLAAERPSIVFDERAIGTRGAGGLTQLLIEEWHLGPTLLLLLLLFALIVLRGSSSIGRRTSTKRTESRVVDLIESLGSFFDRTMSNREALEQYRKTVLRRYGERFSRVPPAVENRVGTQGVSSLDESQLRQELEPLNQIYRRVLDGTAD